MNKLYYLLTALFLLLGTLSVCGSTTPSSAASFSIRLTGGVRTCEASFVQDTVYTPGHDSQDMLALIDNTVTAVNIYGVASFGRLSHLVTNSLDGTFIGLTTNDQTSYRFNFDLVTGRTLYIHDHANDSLILVHPDSQYVFTAAAMQTIDNRFQIVDPNVPAKGTICFSYNALHVSGNVGDMVLLTLSDGTAQEFFLTATTQDFDLSVYPQGHAKVEFDGQTYVINIGISGQVSEITLSADLEPGGNSSNPIDL